MGSNFTTQVAACIFVYTILFQPAFCVHTKAEHYVCFYFMIRLICLKSSFL